jgi:hypothetical protein
MVRPKESWSVPVVSRLERLPRFYNSISIFNWKMPNYEFKGTFPECIIINSFLIKEYHPFFVISGCISYSIV